MQPIFATHENVSELMLYLRVARIVGEHCIITVEIEATSEKKRM